MTSNFERCQLTNKYGTRMNCKFAKIFQIALSILLVSLPIFIYPRSVDAQESSLENSHTATTSIVHVPYDVPDLQNANYQVPDGGVIEISGVIPHHVGI